MVLYKLTETLSQIRVFYMLLLCVKGSFTKLFAELDPSHSRIFQLNYDFLRDAAFYMWDHMALLFSILVNQFLSQYLPNCVMSHLFTNFCCVFLFFP